MCSNLKAETAKKLQNWSDVQVVPFRDEVQRRIAEQLDFISTQDVEKYNTDDLFVEFVSQAFNTSQAALWFPEMVRLAAGASNGPAASPMSILMDPAKALVALTSLKSLDLEKNPLQGLSMKGFDFLVEAAKNDDLADLCSGDSRKQIAACKSIARKPGVDNAVLTRVAELLGDDSVDIKTAAEFALTHHRRFNKDATESVVETMLANVRVSTRISAMALLVRWELGNEFKAYNHPKNSVYALEKNLEQVDPIARRLAEKHLTTKARIGRPHLALLAEALSNESEDSSTRQMACAAICGSGEAAVPYLPAVRAIIEHKDLRLRASALRSLGGLGEIAGGYLGLLVQYAKSDIREGNDIRQAACEGLAAASDSAEVHLPALQRIARKSSIMKVFRNGCNVGEDFIAFTGSCCFCFCCYLPAAFICISKSPWPAKVVLFATGAFVVIGHVLIGVHAALKGFGGFRFSDMDYFSFGIYELCLFGLLLMCMNLILRRRHNDLSLRDLVWRVFLLSFCGFFEDDKIIKAATDAAQEIEQASARKFPTRRHPPVQHTMSANARAGLASATAASSGASAAAFAVAPDEEAPPEPMKRALARIGRVYEDEEGGMSPTLPGTPIGRAMEETPMLR